MLSKKHNPLATLFVLLTLVGVSKPAKALLVTQNSEVTTSIAKQLPQEAEVKIAAFKSAFNIDNIDLVGESVTANSNNNSNLIADTDVNSDTPLDIGNLNANFDSEDSGSLDPDLEDSGSPDSGLENSGEINFDSSR